MPANVCSSTSIFGIGSGSGRTEHKSQSFAPGVGNSQLFSFLSDS
jgi:hypothetical protein